MFYVHVFLKPWRDRIKKEVAKIKEIHCIKLLIAIWNSTFHMALVEGMVGERNPATSKIK